MSFIFNLKNLRRLGYAIDVTDDHVEVSCNSVGMPILQQTTYRRIYSNLESTTLTGVQQETIVHEFTKQLLNQEIWNLAVSDDLTVETAEGS